MEINSGRLPFDLPFHPASPLVADGGLHLYRYAAESQPQRDAINRLVNLTETTIASGDDKGYIKGLGYPERLVSILPNRIIKPLAEHSEYPIELIAFSNDRKFLGSISHDQMFKTTPVDASGIQTTPVDASGIYGPPPTYKFRVPVS